MEKDTPRSLENNRKRKPRSAKNGMASSRAKDLAKAGMTASLGVLVATGLYRTRTSRRVHLLAGAALIGFSAWHYLLYQPSSREPGT